MSAACATNGGLSLNNVAPNAGVIRAGRGGTVAINGALDAGAGMVSIEIGGTAANQFDHLSVTGAAHSTPLRAPATLSRTLNLAATGGFDPALGATFPSMTFASRTGQWATVNGNTGTGKQFTVGYSVTATVAAAAPAPARLTVSVAQGTSPNTPGLRPGDVFQLSALLRTPNGARFQLSPLRHRRLAKPRLPTIAGTGEVFNVLDSEATAFPQYFYRLVFLP